MDEAEYNLKYANLRILKSIQEYLKDENISATAVYPINVPDDLLYQVLKLHGAEKADKLVHYIFKIGLNVWSEKIFSDVFGSQKSLEEFIEIVKRKTKEQL
jgi:hypothetical protein